MKARNNMNEANNHDDYDCQFNCENSSLYHCKFIIPNNKPGVTIDFNIYKIFNI